MFLWLKFSRNFPGYFIDCFGFIFSAYTVYECLLINPKATVFSESISKGRLYSKNRDIDREWKQKMHILEKVADDKSLC